MNEKLPRPSIVELTSSIEKISFEEAISEINPIIFDTNFLFTTFQFKIDIIAELQKIVGKKLNLFIYEGTVKELESIENRKTKNKRFLPLIAKMLSLYGFRIIKSKKGYIDEQILENITKDVIVATNDKLLRKEILKNGGRVIYLRQKNHLELE